MNYKEIKEKLKNRVSSVKYFDAKTFDIIISDRKKALEILEKGGNAQEFYKNSETAKTRFYNENSTAYCELLAIIA